MKFVQARAIIILILLYAAGGKMGTQKISRVHWLAGADVVIGVLVLLNLGMMFGIMSSNFYTIFNTIFGGRIGEAIKDGIGWAGIFLTFPIGILNIIAGILAKRIGRGGDDKQNSRTATTGIAIGVFNTLLGGAVLIFFLFFVTF